MQSRNYGRIRVSGTYETRGEDETMALAAALARRLRGRETLLLYGGLGAGKTTFVRGLVMGLGGRADLVASPTFVLVHIYSVRVPVYHIDLYRMESGSDIAHAGILDLLDEPALRVVEWADRLGNLRVPYPVSVWFTYLGPQQRRIDLQVGRCVTSTATVAGASEEADSSGSA